MKTIRGNSRNLSRAMLAGVAAIAIAAGSAPALAQAGRAAQVNVPAQSMASALNRLGRQTNTEIVFAPAAVRGLRAPALQGSFTVDQALARMLSGSGLRFRRTGQGAIVVEPGSGEAQAGSAAADSESAETEGYAEILVTGQRTLNADVRRSEDDVQPYVVFSGDDIARSGATQLEDFLRTRLPMNSQAQGSNQFGMAGPTPSAGPGGAGPNTGLITLRGLSANQTLILVDGRRVPGVAFDSGEGTGQPNINGIPTAAIERIEVLPATAGGIYGGGATAGVINVVLKRNYTGLDLRTTYGNAFDSDVGFFNFNLSGGATLWGTSIMVTASRRHQNSLQIGDRDFLRRARELNWQNRPADFTGFLYGSTPNVCTALATTQLCLATATSLVLDPAYGGTSLGSRYSSLPPGYAGLPVDGVSGLVANAGHPNFEAGPFFGTLLPSSDSDSYSLTLRRHFGEHVEGFLDLGIDRTWSTNSAANRATVNLLANDPNNPFQQNIAVSLVFQNSLAVRHSETESDHARAGLIAHLPGDWTASLEQSWGRTTSSTLSYGGHSLQSYTAVAPYLRSVALRDPNVFPVDLNSLPTPSNSSSIGPFRDTLVDSVLRVAGPALDLPGGPIALSGYVERREESIGSGTSIFIAPPTVFNYFWYAAKSQEVRSIYVEARAPIFSSAYNIPVLSALELFGALRYDDYATTSSAEGLGYVLASPSGPFPAVTNVTNHFRSLNYTIGLRYAPIPDLTFRASYGTGFIPPNLGQITSNQGPVDLPFVNDPRRGDTPVAGTITQISGGNPHLQPEKSTSFSAGLIFAPRALRGLRFSADYTRIAKTGEIAQIDTDVILTHESQFSDRVIRGPNLPGDLPGWAGPITQLDVSFVNLANTHVEAYDFQLDYEIVTSHFGTWRPYLIATHQTQLVHQTFASDPLTNQTGFVDGPLAWRGNFGLTWGLGPWSAGWDAQYYGSYRSCASTDLSAVCANTVQRQGSDKIRRQIYNDVFVRYALSSGVFAGSDLQFGVQNVFNEEPPIIATQSGLGYSTYGDPSLRRFMLTFHKHFGG